MADFIEGMIAGQNYKLNQFKLQEAPIKLEEEKMALTVAKADFDKRQKMADMLAGKSDQIPPGQNPLDIAVSALTRMGSAAAQFGLPEEAANDFAKAAVISAQQDNAAYKAWQIASQKAKFATSILANVHDQASFDQANEYIKMETGQDSALKGKPYSLELIATLKESIEKHESASLGAYRAAQAKLDEAKAATERARPELIRAQARNADARTENLLKNGSVGAVPKSRTVTDIANALRSEYDLEAPQARTVAGPIALDAERRVKEEKLTGPEAVKAAIEYSKRHGELAGMHVTFQRAGTSPDKPLPLPSSIDGFKDQMIYQTKNGPVWYDAATKKAYPIGEGPDDNEADDKDDE